MTGEGIESITGEWESRKVYIDGVELDPVESQRIKNHSPDGFAWGYGGSGSSQLALAIMLKFLPIHEALRCYHDFKRDFIASMWREEDFYIAGETVQNWINERRAGA